MYYSKIIFLQDTCDMFIYFYTFYMCILAEIYNKLSENDCNKSGTVTINVIYGL